MNTHEAFVASSPNPRETAADREAQQELMLQLGWLAHRCPGLRDEQALEEQLQTMAKDNPALQAQIARSNAEEKQTIVLDDMIGASSEAAWFRIHFPNDKSAPLAREYAMVLKQFIAAPEEAYVELDRLFAESITTH